MNPYLSLLFSLLIALATASVLHESLFSNTSIPNRNQQYNPFDELAAKTRQSSTTETFPVCDFDFALDVLQNWKDCEPCSDVVQWYDLFGTEHPSARCPSECCADTFLIPEIGHFLRCKNRCCYRLVSLQLSPGLSDELAAFVIESQGFAVNGVTYLRKTSIGRCVVEDGPSDDPSCGPRCATQIWDRSACVGRNTAEIPRWGEKMELPPCSEEFPDGPSQGGGSQTSSGGQTGNSDPACFPGNAKISLRNGKIINMRNLQPGQQVLVGSNHHSEVIGFTHEDANVYSEHVRLSLNSGHRLKLTEGHYIYANQGLIPAGKVVMGDIVRLGDGRSATVIEVTRVVARGLFNPQTKHGDIVVDGVVVSTYTRAISPAKAHAMLAPIRALTWKNIAPMLSNMANVFRPWLTNIHFDS